jgi:uncharacterized protein YdeI (YjbR/CyaY-like superfamily)
MRKIVWECGLTEELKWKAPCYTQDGKNILMVGAFKNHAVISFFKGVLLSDAKGILEKPGENSQSARLIRFDSVDAIRDLEADLKAFIAQAIQVEQAGTKVDFSAKDEIVIPSELERKFDSLPALRDAFFALTPGRQRGYVLYFQNAKQTKTRVARIEKYVPRILEGLGFHD